MDQPILKTKHRPPGYQSALRHNKFLYSPERLKLNDANNLLVDFVISNNPSTIRELQKSYPEIIKWNSINLQPSEREFGVLQSDITKECILILGDKVVVDLRPYSTANYRPVSHNHPINPYYPGGTMKQVFDKKDPSYRGNLFPSSADIASFLTQQKKYEHIVHTLITPYILYKKTITQLSKWDNIPPDGKKNNIVTFEIGKSQNDSTAKLTAYVGWPLDIRWQLWDGEVKPHAIQDFPPHIIESGTINEPFGSIN